MGLPGRFDKQTIDMLKSKWEREIFQQIDKAASSNRSNTSLRN